MPGGSLSMAGGPCLRCPCPVESLSRGSLPRGSLCLEGLYLEGLCQRDVSVQGSLSMGVSVRGGGSVRRSLGGLFQGDPL